MRDFQRRLTNGFYALVSLPATAMGFALSIQISALSWLLTTRYHLDIHQVGIVWATRHAMWRALLALRERFAR